MKQKDFDWLQSWMKCMLNRSVIDDFVDIVNGATDDRPPPIDEEEYMTLEQQIIDLWKSRGMEVVFIKVEPTGDCLTWTISAKKEPPK